MGAFRRAVGGASRGLDRERQVTLVFDTNVLAYALLGVADHRDEALEALTAAAEVWAPDSLRSELINTVWQWVRFNQTTLETGHAVLRDAEVLITRLVPSRRLWSLALDLAVAHEHPAYDTLFVALAVQTEQKVVTYDRKLLERFPEHTISAAGVLRSPTGS